MSIDSERFWLKVDIRGPNECWNWTGTINPNLHAQFWYNEENIGVHRLAYWLYYGNIDHNLSIRHTCDNKICCNPRHLVQGTHEENIQDCVDRRLLKYGKDNHNSKLNDEAIKVIKWIGRNRPDISHETLADLYKVNQSTVNRIIRGEIWRHVP